MGDKEQLGTALGSIPHRTGREGRRMGIRKRKRKGQSLAEVTDKTVGRMEVKTLTRNPMGPTRPASVSPESLSYEA